MVREEKEKKELSDYSQNLIITFHDISDHIFDDVLVYNYFANSPLSDSVWREMSLLLKEMDEKEIKSENADIFASPLTFPLPTDYSAFNHNDTHINLLVNELRKLQTIITSAARRVRFLSFLFTFRNSFRLFVCLR